MFPSIVVFKQALQKHWEPSRFTYGVNNVVAVSQPPRKRLKIVNTLVILQSMSPDHPITCLQILCQDVIDSVLTASAPTTGT